MSDQQIESNMKSAALLGDKESDKYVEKKGKKNEPVVKKSLTSRKS